MTVNGRMKTAPIVNHYDVVIILAFFDNVVQVDSSDSYSFFHIPFFCEIDFSFYDYALVFSIFFNSIFFYFEERHFVSYFFIKVYFSYYFSDIFSVNFDDFRYLIDFNYFIDFSYFSDFYIISYVYFLNLKNKHIGKNSVR